MPMNTFDHTDELLRHYQAFKAEGDLSPSSYRQYIQQAKALISEKFHSGVDIQTVLHAHTYVIDNLLKDLWHTQTAAMKISTCVVAVGGYGRREMHPASDIDLLILLGGEPSSKCEDMLASFITQLWDIGLEVGHSVRTLKECSDNASRDLSIITNLLEARWLCGDRDIYHQMLEITSIDNMWSSQNFFQAKLREQEERYEKFGDSAYRVEPNLKEGKGGLRDIQMIGWVIKRQYGNLSLHELIEHELIDPAEYIDLQHGRAFLWEVRFVLHELTKRKEDRLLFDYQHELAIAFGHDSEDRNTVVEAFMQSYYKTITELERLTDVIIGALHDRILTKHHPVPTMLGEWYLKHGSLIGVKSPDVFVLYPTALLEIFLILQITPNTTGLTPETIRLIRLNSHRIDTKFRQQKRHRQIFIQILQQKSGITYIMRLMNRYGMLAAYIPAFANIVGRMQYDLFHAYTVDEHTLWVIRNLRHNSTGIGAKELPFCSEVFHRIPKPELLYLAGLFHDIAKGRNGDHSKLGAVDAYEFCREHGLSQLDSNLVSWLVYNHLLMSTTAQRKDISDPEVVKAFAEQVKDQNALDYLFLLTVADIKGTNPKLWNSWKSTLLHDLHRLTSNYLAFTALSKNPAPPHEIKRKEALERLTQEGFTEEQCEAWWKKLGREYLRQNSLESICWHTEHILTSSEAVLPLVRFRLTPSQNINVIFIYDTDLGNLFTRVVATLEQLRLNIVQAMLVSTKHHDLYTIHVLGHDNKVITDPHEEERVIEALQTNLLATEFTPRRQRQSRILKNFDITTEVNFRQNMDRNLTLLELKTVDMTGLLSRVGQTLSSLDIRVHHAIISTLGEQVEDVFHITTRNGERITRKEDQQMIREAIVKALNP